jgi:phosphohistidine swiveling domain-containing protein
VKEGDIIVAPMTTPIHIPAMQKSAGIITDEGGITCHAAIVAREMKKPCIIGTKIATQVLKDGDLVEVDADNGVVRILEQAEKEKEEKKIDTANVSFQKIVDEATILTARESSIQRELLYGRYFRNNPLGSILFIITLLKSGTDVEWYVDKQTSEKFFEANAKEFLTP